MDRSKMFYTALGFAINQKFTNRYSVCVIISEHIYAMLLLESYYQQFYPGKSIIDAKKTSGVGLCISLPSRHAVDELAEKAKNTGGNVYQVPLMQEMSKTDYAYGLSIEDLDGHVWEPMWMDEQKMPSASDH
ncbi:MAG: hypothetical protein QM538_03130 [Methylacidiphilales bacterium]|nr:hypothetical protein [Candidatus Methylacidiphilales bacterium]